MDGQAVFNQVAEAIFMSAQSEAFTEQTLTDLPNPPAVVCIKDNPTIAEVHQFILSSGISAAHKQKNPFDFAPDLHLSIPVWYVNMPYEPESEQELESAIATSLNYYGIQTQRQVKTDFGRTDIETPHEVCEVKINCDRDSLFDGIGQAVVYSFASLRDRYRANPKTPVLFCYAKTNSNLQGINAVLYAAQKMGIAPYLVVRERKRTHRMVSSIEGRLDILRAKLADLGFRNADKAIERMRLNLLEMNDLLCDDLPEEVAA